MIKKIIFSVIGLSSAISCMMIVIWTFILSTVQGLNGEGYSVQVVTNTMGEHYYELIYLCIGFICFFFYIYWFFPRKKKQEVDMDLFEVVKKI